MINYFFMIKMARTKATARQTCKQQFIYENYNFNKDELPEFIKLVFDNRELCLRSKENFLNEFVNYYLNDEEFRESTKDCVLIFDMNKYYNYDYPSNVNNYDSKGHTKIIMAIE
jgi:hypothetical protein